MDGFPWNRQFSMKFWQILQFFRRFICIFSQHLLYLWSYLQFTIPIFCQMFVIKRQKLLTLCYCLGRSSVVRWTNCVQGNGPRRQLFTIYYRKCITKVVHNRLTLHMWSQSKTSSLTRDCMHMVSISVRRPCCLAREVNWNSISIFEILFAPKSCTATVPDDWFASWFRPNWPNSETCKFSTDSVTNHKSAVLNRRPQTTENLGMQVISYGFESR